MISFFRKIRKNAIENNNLKKVALYALGEIFLIVVGILIAVSINNWNKERNDREALKVSLEGLMTDMRQDARRFSFLYNQFNKSLNSCDSIIRLLELPEAHPDRRRIFKHDFIRLFVLNPHIAAFEEMKNSGKLYLMKDTDLSADIIKYYTSLTRNEGYVENGNNGIRFHMDQPVLNDFWLALRKEDGSNHIRWLADKNSDTHRALEFLVYKAKGRYKSNGQKIQQLQDQVEGLIARVELEIKSF